MPLRCLGKDGNQIFAFDLGDEEWSSLVNTNRKSRFLKMPCCDAGVVLKVSRRGTRFFAHKARGECASRPETENHLYLKQLAVIAAREAGWDVSSEVKGASPDGEEWIAAVLATTGSYTVAIEVQWSGQTPEETMRRQERYKKSGVRCLWLLRQPGFPISEELPAVCIDGDLEVGFKAMVPKFERMSARDRSLPDRWTQIIPMQDFLTAVFERRFRYGIPVGALTHINIHTGMLPCWRDNCFASTRIIFSIEFVLGPHRIRYSLSEIEELPNLLDYVTANLPTRPDMTVIKKRHSRTEGKAYLSNGCCRCDALIGRFFEHEAQGADEEVFELEPIRMHPDWKYVLDKRRLGWGVFKAADV